MTPPRVLVICDHCGRPTRLAIVDVDVLVPIARELGDDGQLRRAVSRERWCPRCVRLQERDDREEEATVPS